MTLHTPTKGDLIDPDSWPCLPQRIPAGDRLEAVLKFNLAAVHLAPNNYAAELAFAPHAVPSIEIWILDNRALVLFDAH
jgi:hypothetical protein